ncbi:hypothetical protein ABDX87_20075 [Pseudomonas abietaniphila]|uniref:hypothetical protein n=1 Tax=Pseudomonas abietaniphila TaxID=89065 RepID=UPI0032174322
MADSRELAKVIGNTVSSMGEVDDIQYKEYQEHRNVIRAFSNEFDLLRMVVESYDDFMSHLEKVAENLASAKEMLNQSVFDPLAFTSGRLLLSYLAATRTFLDHTQTSLAREYGKKSDQLAYFKLLTAREHDERISYRLLYKLRNYVQHCGIPPVEFAVQHEPGVGINIDLTMSPGTLLSVYDEWGAFVKKDLQECEGPIYLVGIVDENLESLKRIYLSLYVSNKATVVRQSYSWVCQLIGTNSPEDIFCFFNTPAEAGARTGPVTFKMEWIPTQALRQVNWVEAELAEFQEDGNI